MIHLEPNCSRMKYYWQPPR